MFMTIYVVLIMSSCHYQDTDRLWCIGLCQVVITKTSQAMSYLHSKCHDWANDTMTVVINMHKKPLSYSWYVSCHDYEGVMSVLCTPLQVKCYRENQQQGAEEESKGRRLGWILYIFVLWLTADCPLHNIWTSFAQHVNCVCKKAHHCVFLLRWLKGFNVRQNILTTVCGSLMESVMTFHIVSWYSLLSAENKLQLSRIIKQASKIIGISQLLLSDLYNKAVKRKAASIIIDSTHPLLFIYFHQVAGSELP